MVISEQVFSELRGEVRKSGKGIRSGVNSFERLATIFLGNKTRDFIEALASRIGVQLIETSVEVSTCVCT